MDAEKHDNAEKGVLPSTTTVTATVAAPADSSSMRETFFETMPDNDFGRFRQRWNADAFQLNHILPAPRHDFTFTDRRGWRYHPCAKFLDRLGDTPEVPMLVDTTKPLPVGEASIGILEDEGTDEEFPVEEKREREGKKERERPTLTSSIPKKARFHNTASIINTVNNDNMSIAATTVTASTKSTSSTNPQQGNSSNSIATPDIMNSAAVAAKAAGRHKTTTGNVRMAPPGAVPKATLYALYGKKPRRVQLSATDYITWDNGAKTHELKFTSVFVCPITKEAFQAGFYGDSNFERVNNIVWFAKKSTAEHAAAALALDCWNLRENLNMGQHGFDEPYMKGNHPELPVAAIKPEALELIRKAQGIGADSNGAVPTERGGDKVAGAIFSSAAHEKTNVGTAKAPDLSRRGQRSPPPPQPLRGSGSKTKATINNNNSNVKRGGNDRGYYGPASAGVGAIPERGGLPPPDYARGRSQEVVVGRGGYSSNTRGYPAQKRRYRETGRGYDDGFRKEPPPPPGTEQQYYNSDQQQQQGPYAGEAHYGGGVGQQWDGNRGNEYYDRPGGGAPQQGAYGNSEYYDRGVGQPPYQNGGGGGEYVDRGGAQGTIRDGAAGYYDHGGGGSDRGYGNAEYYEEAYPNAAYGARGAGYYDRGEQMQYDRGSEAWDGNGAVGEYYKQGGGEHGVQYDDTGNEAWDGNGQLQYGGAGGPVGNGRGDYNGPGGSSAAYGGDAPGQNYDGRPGKVTDPQQGRNEGDSKKDVPTAAPGDNKDSNNMDLR